MSLGELVKWCRDNDVSEDTELCFDRGIDLIENVSHAVWNGVEIMLYPKDVVKEVEDESVTA